MARVTGGGAVYELADLFRQRCLVTEHSLLWPEHRAWTITTIDALVDAFMGHADYSNRSFLDKLHDQLAEQPDDVLRVAVDTLAFYFLFPRSATVGREKKLESIRAIVDWRPEALAIAPNEQRMLEAAFTEGIGNTGTYYLSGRPWHLTFFLAFARGVIAGRADPYDPASCMRLINEIKPALNGRVQSRHILLHLLFPDQFEATASEAQKQQIVAGFQEDSGGAQDLDEALANIRRALESRGEQANFSFYDPAIRILWEPNKATKEPPIIEATRGGLGKSIGTGAPSPAQFWWVNQGATYELERAGGYLWAPKKGKGRYVPAHWTNMEKLRAGDLVVHYANTAIRAVGLVREPTVDAPRPAELPTEAWDEDGYFARVDYFPVKQLIRLDEIPREWRSGTALSTPDGPSPFAVDASIKQGYLYPLAKDFIDKLFDRFADRLPDNLGPGISIQKSWLFQANPKVWNLAAELQNRRIGDVDDWAASRFREQMAPGQSVVLWQSGNDAGVYAIGELTDVPFERPTAEFWPDRDQREPTEWAIPYKYTQILSQPILRSELLTHPILKDLSVIHGPQGTNFKVTREQWEALIELLPDEVDPATLSDLADLTYLDPEDLEELEALLEDKRQLVLEGPPGSGKTFLATHFARYFARLPLQGKHDERVETVQFHQSYGYEDFVQGIRPVTDEHGHLQYHVLPGIFMRMCDVAARNPDQRFVLIIDEINRGNLSRIFGELLLLLEYRDKRVRLPYGAVDGKDEQAYLSIPRNLYLIGTMNSTDRSLALIDYALRRRFYFYRLLPVVDGHAAILDRWFTARGVSEHDRQRVVRLFVKLNQEVERHLGSEFQIGHSYFMRDDIGSDEGIDRQWRRAIMPLLEEYLHGLRDRESVLTGLAWRHLLAAPVAELEPAAASPETV